MLQDRSDGTRLDDVRPDTEHVDVALIADHQNGPMRRTAAGPGHVVDGSVEVLALLGELALRRVVLAPQLATIRKIVKITTTTEEPG